MEIPYGKIRSLYWDGTLKIKNHTQLKTPHLLNSYVQSTGKCNNCDCSPCIALKHLGLMCYKSFTIFLPKYNVYVKATLTPIVMMTIPIIRKIVWGQLWNHWQNRRLSWRHPNLLQKCARLSKIIVYIGLNCVHQTLFSVYLTRWVMVIRLILWFNFKMQLF